MVTAGAAGLVPALGVVRGLGSGYAVQDTLAAVVAATCRVRAGGGDFGSARRLCAGVRGSDDEFDRAAQLGVGLQGCTGHRCEQRLRGLFLRGSVLDERRRRAGATVGGSAHDVIAELGQIGRRPASESGDSSAVEHLHLHGADGDRQGSRCRPGCQGCGRRDGRSGVRYQRGEQRVFLRDVDIVDVDTVLFAEARQRHRRQRDIAAAEILELHGQFGHVAEAHARVDADRLRERVEEVVELDRVRERAGALDLAHH